MFFATLFSTALLVATSHAQQVLVFGSGALPQCAQGCTLLQQAQAACVPPAAPVTDQAIYESCFCQSGYLLQLKTDPSTVCGTVCQGSDLSQIASWYSSNCANNGAAAAGPPTTTTAAPSTSTSSVATSTSTAGSSSNNGQPSSTSPTQAETGGWWANHWKWIVMIIVIFVVLGLLALIGVLLRRRHRRNKDKNTSRFNDGITTRTTPMAMAPGAPAPGQSAYNEYDRDRGTQSPAMYGAAGRSDSRLASSGNLSRIRERDIKSSRPNTSRSVPGSAPAEGSVRPSPRGKGRFQVDESELGPGR